VAARTARTLLVRRNHTTSRWKTLLPALCRVEVVEAAVGTIAHVAARQFVAHPAAGGDVDVVAEEVVFTDRHPGEPEGRRPRPARADPVRVDREGGTPGAVRTADRGDHPGDPRPALVAEAETIETWWAAVKLFLTTGLTNGLYDLDRAT
jgi:hypothetical protein